MDFVIVEVFYRFDKTIASYPSVMGNPLFCLASTLNASDNVMAFKVFSDGQPISSKDNYNMSKWVTEYPEELFDTEFIDLSETISITWSIEDIYNMDPDDLSVTQCKEILKYLEKNHDASVGINWSVVSDAIQEYKLKEGIPNGKNREEEKS